MMSNPTRVDIERGTLRLDSYPMATTLIPANAEPFMHVYVWPEAALALADGVRDFNLDKAHHMKSEKTTSINQNFTSVIYRRYIRYVENDCNNFCCECDV